MASGGATKTTHLDRKGRLGGQRGTLSARVYGGIEKKRG